MTDFESLVWHGWRKENLDTQEIAEKIGVTEVDEGYFDIACRRIEEAYSQPDLVIAAERLTQADLLEASA